MPAGNREFNDYQPKLARYVRARWPQLDADELCQTAWERLWQRRRLDRKAGAERRYDSPLTFLRQAANWAALGEIRRRKRLTALDDVGEEIGICPPPELAEPPPSLKALRGMEASVYRLRVERGLDPATVRLRLDLSPTQYARTWQRVVVKVTAELVAEHSAMAPVARQALLRAVDDGRATAGQVQLAAALAS